ncbi:MAG TPA: outer membrane beta-barrel protein [Opitutaceae bacterium]
MTKRVSQLSGIGATLVALAATASADIKLNDNLTISGYAAGSYEYTSKSGPGGDSYDSLFNGQKDTPSADVVKTAFTYNFKPVTAVVSLYYIPNLPTNEITVLDAYLTYDAGNGVTVSAGKFLSWLGYEAFDTVNMSQITYGAPTVGGLGAVPAYHSGVKVEYGDKVQGAGFAVLDSVYSPTGSFSHGDGELKHNAGFEGYYTYKGIDGLQIWGGFAYDTKGAQGTYQQYHSALTGDVWVQYAINKQITVAAEVTDKDAETASGTALKGWDWLVFGSYTVDDKWSFIGRVSGENPNGATRRDTGLSGYTQYTIGPSYNVTANLLVRAEYSYYKYRSNSVDVFDEDGPVNIPSWNKNFFGVQVLFKF